MIIISQVKKNGLIWYVPSGKFEYIPLSGIEETFISWVRKIFPYSGQFLDIGANVGLYTINLAHNFEEIIAVEPNPVNAYILKKNIELNHFDHIKVLEVASWNRVETLYFNQMAYDTLASNARVQVTPSTYSVNKPFSVLGVPLDDYDLHPNFIKMDIEGAEFDAIYGLTETLDRSKPLMLIEIHQYENGKTIEDFLKIMEELNYIPLTLLGGWNGENIILRHYIFQNKDRI